MNRSASSKEKALSYRLTLKPNTRGITRQLDQSTAEMSANIPKTNLHMHKGSEDNSLYEKEKFLSANKFYVVKKSNKLVMCKHQRTVDWQLRGE